MNDFGTNWNELNYPQANIVLYIEDKHISSSPLPVLVVSFPCPIYTPPIRKQKRMAGVGRLVSVHFILRGRIEDESTGMQWQ